MTPTGLPVPHEQTSDPGYQSPPSDTQTAPADPPLRCLELENALEESLIRLRQDIRLMQQRQEAWYRCVHGEDLFGSAASGHSSSKVAGIQMRCGLAELNRGLSTIVKTAGLHLGGD